MPGWTRCSTPWFPGPSTGPPPPGSATMRPKRLEAVRVRGVCMWRALREGDLVLMRPSRLGDAPIERGQVAVAHGPAGLVAHRVQAVHGSPQRLRITLGGDLAGDDRPRDASEIVG